MNYSDDIVYIQKIREGNINAFSFFVSKYQDMLYNLVYKILYNKEDTEDLLQDIFVKIFNSLEKFNGKSELSTWIYSIAYNTTISKLRKKRPLHTNYEENIAEIDESEFYDEMNKMEKNARIESLEEAMKTLSYDDRFLISLYYMDEKKIEEICDIMKLKPSNVKIRLYRLRKKLAIEIERRMR